MNLILCLLLLGQPVKASPLGRHETNPWERDFVLHDSTWADSISYSEQMRRLKRKVARLEEIVTPDRFSPYFRVVRDSTPIQVRVVTTREWAKKHIPPGVYSNDEFTHLEDDWQYFYVLDIVTDSAVYRVKDVRLERLP